MEYPSGRSNLLKPIQEKVKDNEVSEEKVSAHKQARNHRFSLDHVRIIPLRWATMVLKAVFDFTPYRLPMRVTEYSLHRDTFQMESAYFFCPRCDVTLERDYQAYCDRCGQCLNWEHIAKAKCRPFEGRSMNSAMKTISHQLNHFSVFQNRLLLKTVKSIFPQMGRKEFCFYNRL